MISTKPEQLKEAYPWLHPLVAKALSVRGISIEDINVIFNPDYSKNTHAPHLLKDCDKAAQLLVDAIQNNVQIGIWTDYDHDGISAAVIWNHFFRQVGYPLFEVYIPDRHIEGFGLNTGGIDQLHQRGVKLLITSDTGIRNVEETKHAKNCGMQVIITDHHQPGDVLPPADAIVNPAQKDCTYPFKELCGAGVAFKLIQHTATILQKDIKYASRLFPGWDKWLLDMVAIATLSDMVPLHGENRVLAYYGLQVLRKSKRPAIKVLCNRLKLVQEKIDETDVGFSITPRINAASRSGTTRDAYQFFSSTDPKAAVTFFEKLDYANSKRKVDAALISKEARKIIDAQNPGKVIVFGNPHWKPALLGLVASKLVDAFHKPVLLWGQEGQGKYKGSIRTPKGISAQTVLNAIAPLCDEYGGHEGAGGFSVKPEFITQFSLRVQEAIEPINLGETSRNTSADLSLTTLADFDPVFVEQFQRLRPFGCGFVAPLIELTKVVVISFKKFGKTREHIECIVSGSGETGIRCVGFFMPDVDLKTGALIILRGNFEIEKTTKAKPWMKIVDIEEVK